MKRSSCASGSGYVPSYSIGFCVATTRNGSGSGRAMPSTLTWRSCIASSSAACVLGGVRLISSASTRFVKIGPGRNASSPARNVIVPVRSDGSMSGVNCTRRKSTPIARANALASSVLATPGTPFEQHVAADGGAREQHLDDVVLTDDHLAHLAHDAIPELVHCILPLRPPTRAIARPNARTLASSETGASSAAISSSVQPNDARRVRDRVVVGGRAEPGARAMRARVHRCAAASAPARSCVRSRLTDSACTYSARAGGRSRATADRADRSGGRATTRTRARPAATSSERDLPAHRGSRRARGSCRSRARLRRTRPAGSASPASASAERGVVGRVRGSRSRAATRRRGRGSRPARPARRVSSAAPSPPTSALPGAGRRPRSDAGAVDVAHVAERRIDRGPRVSRRRAATSAGRR